MLKKMCCTAILASLSLGAQAQEHQYFNFFYTGFVNDGVFNCLDSWDHVPMRSWPLFKARQVLRTLFQSDLSLVA